MFTASLLALALSAPAPAGDWTTDHAAALKEAGKTDKLVLADFTGSDWCGWCIKLKKEVFDTPEFAAWAKEKVVLLELDFPRKKELPAELEAQNTALARKFAIRGYPTVLLLDSKGEEVARTGYVAGGPEAWIARTEKLLAAARAPEKSDGPWMTDHAAAVALARKTGKPILADFTGSDWCGWCIKLEKEVFDTPEFLAWAKEHVVLLELDYPRRTPQPAELEKQNEALAKKYGIRGFPTILFLDAEGEVLGRSGYKAGGPGNWTEDAARILKRADRR